MGDDRFKQGEYPMNLNLKVMAAQVTNQRLHLNSVLTHFLFDNLDQARIEKFSGMKHASEIKSALNLFYEFKLADTLMVLSKIPDDWDPQASRALAFLRLRFPIEKYSADGGWNYLANPNLEEQTALFRGLETTFNTIFGWEIPAHNPFDMTPTYLVSDPHYEKKKDHLLSGLHEFKRFLGKISKSIVSEFTYEFYAYLQLCILRGNIADDVSGKPESSSNKEKFFIDDRKEYFQYIAKSQTQDIAMVLDNNGIETFLMLFEAYLLINRGKKVTIFSKQDPTIFSDTTYLDLLFSIKLFEQAFAIFKIPAFSKFKTLSEHIEDGNLMLKQLPCRFDYRGEIIEDHKVVHADFRFFEKYDLVVLEGEFNYGLYFRNQLRKEGVLMNHNKSIPFVKLNPFSKTSLMFRKANKNPREIKIVNGQLQVSQNFPTAGEFIFHFIPSRRVHMPRKIYALNNANPPRVKPEIIEF